jgi:alpha-L-fucosidase
MNRLTVLLTAALLMLAAPALPAAKPSPAPAETPAERDARMAWWRSARLGMFVHWGLYSAAEGVWDGQEFKGGVEWIQHYAGVPAEVYAARLKPAFRPKPGFAREWARLARDLGAEYVVFTAKHHEGFALWDSRVTDFDARAFTGRDLFKEIVNALRAEGLRVGVYFSVIDWHHPDFPVLDTGLPHPLQKHAKDPGFQGATGRVMSRYVDFMHRQAEEVVTRYGKLDILWWDYSSKRPRAKAGAPPS